MSKNIAVPIQTYAALQYLAAAFARGDYPFMIVVGPPGVGKSEAFHNALEGVEHLFVNAALTARGLYEAAFTHKDQPTLIDDLDKTMRDKPLVSILKAFCDSKPKRTLTWTVASRAKDAFPPSYTTSSPVCLILNNWPPDDSDLAPLLDRAIVFSIELPNQEIHQYVGTWFEDLEVFEFIGRHLPLANNLSIRMYINANKLRQNMPDRWQELTVLALRVNSDQQIVLALHRDPTLTTDKDRVSRFIALDGRSRATYYRIKNKLIEWLGGGNPLLQP